MRVAVIGGNAAGATAASTVKRAHPDWEVLMFERGKWTSYAACGFPYVLGNLIESWDKLVARSAEEHRRRGIDVRTGADVTAIDLGRREVLFRDGATGKDSRESFDRLVYATGAVEARPPIPGLEHGLFVHSPEQARRLGQSLQGISRAVVVGGGYIGLEMAEALRRRQVDTVLVDAAPQVMLTLDEDMASLVQQGLDAIGVEVRLSTPLSFIEASGDRFRVGLGADVVDTELVVLALGSKPASKLAADSGLPLGETGAVRVDHSQRTPVDGVFAAGDCAEVWHLVKESWTNIHLGTVANKTGRVAGLSTAGEPASFPGVIGTAVSKICQYEVARTGLSEREARAAGLDIETARIQSRTRAHYYPGSGSIVVKLVAQAGTRRLLGGQIVGTEGAAKRIDVIATAITARMTAADVVDLDLSYAPPYSPVWDPVQVAARQLGKD